MERTDPIWFQWYILFCLLTTKGPGPDIWSFAPRSDFIIKKQRSNWLCCTTENVIGETGCVVPQEMLLVQLAVLYHKKMLLEQLAVFY